MSLIYSCWRLRLTVTASGFLSVVTPCVFPALLHRQSRVETLLSPAVKCPAPFHNTAAAQAAVPMAMSPPIFFLYQRFLAPSSSPFHRVCPVAAEPFGRLARELRSSLEKSQRQLVKGGSAETTKHPFKLKTPRDASEGTHPTTVVTATTKKTTGKKCVHSFPNI